MKKILTQFKREFWESQASFIRTPLYLGGILLGLVLIGIVTTQNNVGQAMQHLRGGEAHNVDPEFLRQLMSGEVFSAHPQILGVGLGAINILFILVLLLILPSYLLSALYNDRRDQSILFWKSLPVTERQNVVTKLGAALLGAPLFYGAAALATGAFYLVVLTLYAGLFLGLPLPGFGLVAGAYLGSIASLIVGWLLLALWAMPIFCWLLFSSALAKKAPFLMALGIPLSLVVLEVWVLGSAHLGRAIRDQINAALASVGKVVPFPDQMGHEVGQALTAPALWVGLVLSAGLIAGAIWLRNYRYEI